MGKKPADKSYVKREKTIKEKQKEFGKQTLLHAAIAMTITTFIGLTAGAAEEVKHYTFWQSIFQLPTILSDNPLYAFPITSTGVLRAGALDLLIGVILVYLWSIDRMKQHHDVNTLKGSSEWADLDYLNAKYAEMVEKVSAFAKILNKIPKIGKKLAKLLQTKKVADGYTNGIYSQNFRMSLNPKFNQKSVNTLIIGTTGTGKSRYYLKPNLLQMNASYVVTDPSGGILKEVGETLRRFGYNIRIFDLSTMKDCNTYNPMKYCYQESDIRKLVNAFIKNTNPDGDSGGGGGKDPFWDDAMNAFLCACVSLLVNYGDDPEVMGGNTYTPCFANLCELTRMANRQSKNATKEQTKNNTASGSELNLIFENLRSIEAKRQGVDVEEMEKPYALREWENFKIAPEKTSTTILMTTAVRLDPFNIEQIRNLTSSDNINLDTFSEQRDILFVIIPTNDRTYNFLVSFMYTQLFDILYRKGESSDGTMTVKLQNGELVKYFTRAQAEAGEAKDFQKTLSNTTLKHVVVNGKMGEHEVMNYAIVSEHGETYQSFKTKKDAITTLNELMEKDAKMKSASIVKIKNKKKGWKFWEKIETASHGIDDSYYEILDRDGNVLSRRPTKSLAQQYQEDLKHTKLVQGNGQALPNHVRFLMDEFPNIGEVPEFKEKLATIRKYEISVCVICQSITQLKGMYPDDYEVIDANCPETIFLGGDENSNNEYLSKKLGSATVLGANQSFDGKKGNSSYNVEERALMKPEELGKIPYKDCIIMLYGDQPVYDEKYHYTEHKNYIYTNDYAKEKGYATKAYVFDRKSMGMDAIASIPLICHVEQPKVIPVIKQLNVKSLKNLIAQSDDLDETVSNDEDDDSFNMSDSNFMNDIVSTTVA